MLRKWMREWFLYNHGRGAVHQDDLYRCLGCRGLITHNMIRSGGCRCGHSRVSPTNPTTMEAVKLLVTPWLVK